LIRIAEEGSQTKFPNFLNYQMKAGKFGWDE
jgi:hypothetical protein